jgi:hypothetical protein
MTPNELADAYLAGAADLRAAVAGMTREQLTARPVPGKWSTLEVICHIADFEPVLADRMKRILAKGDGMPLLLSADENLFAKELKYHERDAAFDGPRHPPADAGATPDDRQPQHQGAGDAGEGDSDGDESHPEPPEVRGREAQGIRNLRRVFTTEGTRGGSLREAGGVHERIQEAEFPGQFFSCILSCPLW